MARDKSSTCQSNRKESCTCGVAVGKTSGRVKVICSTCKTHDRSETADSPFLPLCKSFSQALASGAHIVVNREEHLCLGILRDAKPPED